ncbi:AbrB family transcriptional regulator [Candidatus Solirubrobacter pratensis]|uniref:AbrB family transcriptional regulator n=1 Tax=Candidatus Solirubrobacter pratensis TaxID=1298857 RepID=UPI000424CBF5|nr:AbrB family transcriptional regulator [Candidatus Solirubrobacter pratensis]
MRGALPWVLLAAAVAVTALLLDLAGMPSPTLFAALLVGIVVALRRPDAFALPNGVFTGAQAVTGVTLGAYLQSSSLSAIADSWLPVGLVSLGTLALSLAAGVVLSRTTELDPATAALGSIAGGASGIVGMSDELGGDDRLVAFMQYLRVLVVVLLTPAVAALTGGHAAGGGSAAPAFGEETGWLLTVLIAPVGVLGGRRLHLPSLIGPMLIAGALTLAGAGFAVPPVLRELAFALIGLMVGLRFTVATLRQVGRLVIPVLISLVALLLACFGLAVILHLTAGVSLRDAYFATTPGGLYAVLAIAVGAGADTTFILAVQALRVFVMILLAPLAVRAVVRPGSRIRMSETPITPQDPDIPEEPPPAEDGSPEVDDQPLGVPRDLDPEDAPLPGLPRKEPPQAD